MFLSPSNFNMLKDALNIVHDNHESGKNGRRLFIPLPIQRIKPRIYQTSYFLSRRFHDPVDLVHKGNSRSMYPSVLIFSLTSAQYS